MAARKSDTLEEDLSQSEQTQVRREHVVLEEEPEEPKKDPQPTKEPEKPIGATSPSEPPPRTFVPKAPYPQRLGQMKNNVQLDKILEVFKQVRINIPLLEAIQQIPTYAKVLKDLCTFKRTTNVPKKAFLAQQCSSIITTSTPIKYKDPRCPTISCQIGDHHIEQALLDLGASVNLLPYSIYEELGLGELKPTKVTLQLADASVRYPKGVVEDVLIKVGEFVFPVDFVVLDTRPPIGNVVRIPVILGRPFLATSNALINCRNGVMHLSFGNMTVQINIFNIGKQPRDESDYEICEVSYLEELIESVGSQLVCEDPLEACLAHFGGNIDVENSIKEVNALLDSAPAFERSQWQPKPEILSPSAAPPVPSIEEPPKLDLKPLPDTLKYVFLGPAETLPVIIASDLEKVQEQQLIEILKDHKEAIGWTIADIKGISPSVVQHRIHLEENAKTSREPQRRLNPSMKDVVRVEVLKLLDSGIIYPISDSSWVSPVHVVPKKSGITVVKNEGNELVPTRTQTGWRVCIDYRKLNLATRKDHFPLPFMDQVLERLAGHAFYCFLDGYSGYNQIPIAPEDQDKTTFTCPFGTFAYRRMPFGLCNAPATFQRLMNSTLSPYIGRFCMVYLDDIIVFSKDEASHQTHLGMVLEKLAGAGLKAQLVKCEFGMAKLEFLGHVVSADGIHMDPSKVQAMTDWPVPKSLTEVKGFLGLLNYYRRFIKDFARLALPLTELTKEEARTFVWTADAQAAFVTLKQKMVTGPVLQMPDLQKPFRVHTDACLFAAGATLSQKHGTDWKPVAYFSKKFIPAQRNYDTRDREALGIVLALHEWRCYLQGSHFVVNNDHHTLQKLQTQAKLSSRHARWAEFLQEFDCSIQYVKGVDNAAADAFSRRPDLFAVGATRIDLADSVMQKIKSSYSTDQFWQEQLHTQKRAAVLHEEDDLVWHRFGKLYLPHVLRQQIILEAHRSAYSGHFGVDRVLAKLQEFFWWPRMRQTIVAVLRSCHECQVVAPRTKGKYGLLQPIEVPERCWEQVTLDLVTGLPVSAGFDSCVVFVDRLSKMVHYAPCKKTITAPGMAGLFVKDIVRLHGWPRVVISDRDPRFDAEFWRSVFRGSGTQLRMSTAYHPETDGQTERANRTLLSMLRKFAIDSESSWVEQLPWLEFAYNDSQHCGTGFTPFFLSNGSHPHVPLKNLVTSQSPLVPDDSTAGRAFRRRLDDALEIASGNLRLSQARQSYYSNRTRTKSPIKAGDEVLLDSAVFHFADLKGKLSEKWYGPLRVISADKTTVLVRTPLEKNMHARVHVSVCKLYVRDPDEPVIALPDSQVDKEHLEIKAIVGDRWTKCPRRKEFRVRFMHPPHDTPSHDEWFASTHLKADRLKKVYRDQLAEGFKFVDGVCVPPGVPTPRGPMGNGQTHLTSTPQ